MSKYSEEQLLKIIRDFYDKNNRIPKRREISQTTAIKNKFGSFNEAIVRAGLKPYERLTPSSEIAIKSLTDFFEREKRSPKASEATRANSLYDTRTYFSALGVSKWDEVLKSAGLRPYLSVSNLTNNKDAALNEVINFVKTHKITSVTDYNQKRIGTKLPSSTFINTHFKFSEVLKMAGLAPIINKETITNAILAFIQTNAYTPSLPELSDTFKVSERNITKISGPYNAFLTALNIPLHQRTPTTTDLSKSELIDLYKSMSNKYGYKNGLTGRAIDEISEMPTSATLLNRFGTINNLREICGFEKTIRTSEVWTTEMIIEKLYDTFKANGRLKSKELKQLRMDNPETFPPLTTIFKKLNTSSIGEMWDIVIEKRHN